MKNKIFVFGNFCWLNCVMAYNYSLKDNQLFDRVWYIYYYRNYLNSGKIWNEIINPWPPKELLKCFGGKLTREEYKIKNNTIDYITSYNSSSDLIQYIPIHINEFNIKPTDKYRLKRKKPLTNRINV